MSKYFIEGKGFRPNTPEIEIKKLYAKNIADENLDTLEPIAEGVLAIQIPVWPNKFEGKAIVYSPKTIGGKDYQVKYSSGLLGSFKLGYNNIPIYQRMVKNPKGVDIMTDQPFDARDFRTIPFKYYVVSVSDALKDLIKPGDVVITRPNSGGIQGFNFHDNEIIFLPRVTLMAKEGSND